MKATKALLALAVMMVMIMPSCKKEDLTKSSTNPYIAIFKTAEESIGKKTEDSDKLMKEAGWTYNAQEADWTKKVDDLEFEMEYTYNNTTNVIYMAEFTIESASGKTKTFSDKNYTSFLNMIGQSYNINSTACEFAAAAYGDTEDTVTATFTNYNDFEKAFSKFVAAPFNGADWGTETMGITIDSETEGSKIEWEGMIVDISLAK